MTLEFTEQDLQILDKALQQMPYGVVAELIFRINKQIRDQQNKEEE